jgi:hypothetical protein
MVELEHGCVKERMGQQARSRFVRLAISCRHHLSNFIDERHIRNSRNSHFIQTYIHIYANATSSIAHPHLCKLVVSWDDPIAETSLSSPLQK